MRVRVLLWLLPAFYAFAPTPGSQVARPATSHRAMVQLLPELAKPGVQLWLTPGECESCLRLRAAVWSQSAGRLSVLAASASAPESRQGEAGSLLLSSCYIRSLLVCRALVENAVPVTAVEGLQMKLMPGDGRPRVNVGWACQDEPMDTSRNSVYLLSNRWLNQHTFLTSLGMASNGGQGG